METLKRPLFLALIILNLFVVSGSAYAQENKTSFDAKIKIICETIVTDINPKEVMSIAVVDFSNRKGISADFTKLLTEELTTKLFQTKKFKVVERSLIDKIVKEQKLQLTGPIEKESMKQLGKLIGVQNILTGTISDIGDEVKINARVINVQTGIVLSACSVELDKNEVSDLMLTANTSPEQTNSNIALNNYSARKKKTDELLDPKNEIEFLYCDKCDDGKNIIVEITFISKKDNVAITLGDPYGSKDTKLYTESGISFDATSVYSGLRSTKNKSVYLNLINGVKTLVRIKFKGLSKEYSNIKVFTVGVTLYPQSGPYSYTMKSEFRLNK